MVSKSKRRRLAKANKQRTTLVTTAASNGGRRQKNVSDFVKCALNPFAGVGMSSGVPDRFDGNVVLIDNETIKNYKFENDRDMAFLVLPSFGKNLFICGIDDNGVIMMDGSISVDAMVDANEAYKFSSFRTISLGARVTYVGKPLDASGVLFATQFKPRIGPPLDCKLKASLSAEEGFDIVGVEDTLDKVVRSFDPFSVSMTDIMSSPDSSMLRLSGGCVLVAKHSSGDSWNFSEVWEDDSYLTDLDVTTSNNGVTYANLLGGSAKMFKGFDDNSYGLLFRVTGHQSGVRIIIETKHCIEAIPSLNTGVYRSLARPSAKRDPAAIDTVVDVQRNLPVAVEGGTSSWVSAISKAISGIDVASLARRVGAMALGPGVTAIERLLF